MGRWRNLDSGISRDKLVNQLAVEHGDWAALLYTWGIAHADDRGCLPADPQELLWLVMPARRDKTPEDVALAVAAMLELGLLQMYTDTHVAYPADSFYRHQSYIAKNRRRDVECKPTGVCAQTGTAVPDGAQVRPNGHGCAPLNERTNLTPCDVPNGPSHGVGPKRKKVAAVDWEQEAVAMLAPLPAQAVQQLERLGAMLAAENKTGKVALSRVVREVYDPVARWWAKHKDAGALAHGLQAAIGAGAPNGNYVAKAATRHLGKGGPAAGGNGSRGTILTEHDTWALDDPELRQEYLDHYGARVGLDVGKEVHDGAADTAEA